MKGAVKRKPAFSGPIAAPPSRAIIGFDSLPTGLLSLRLQPFRLLLVLALVVFAVAARADQASITIDKANKTLDRARVTLDEVEKSLGEPNSNEQILRQLRERVAALPVDLQDVIDRLTPRLQAVDARLKELGTPSGDAKPAGSRRCGFAHTTGARACSCADPRFGPPKAAAPAAPAPAAKAPASPGTKAPPPAASPKAPGASSKSPEPDAVPEAKPKMPDTTPAASDSASLGVNAEWADQRKLYDDIDSTLKRARALLVEFAAGSGDCCRASAGAFREDPVPADQRAFFSHPVEGGGGGGAACRGLVKSLFRGTRQ